MTELKEIVINGERMNQEESICIECGEPVIIEEGFYIRYDPEGKQLIVLCNQCEEIDLGAEANHNYVTEAI